LAAWILVTPVNAPDYQQLLERLRTARRMRELTQVEVARQLGQAQSYVSKCESGERRLDALELFRFAELYNLSVYFFLPSPKSEAGRTSAIGVKRGKQANN
jgi:transcriptional regulator with XRE-family HTH domain